jgi:hypothetical protein
MGTRRLDKTDRLRAARRVAVAVALTAVLGAHIAAAQSSLATTDDVLNGQRYLVRADDLVVADPASISSTETKAQCFGLDTDDMEITTADTVAATSVVDLSCVSHSSSSVPFPQQTQTMRMFDLPNDVIVTFAPTAGSSGTDCSNQQAGAMTFYVYDPGTDTHYTFPVPGNIRNRWLHTAAGDFDGDGFDDLFISTDEWTYVATAVDTSSPSSGIKIVASLQTGSGLTPMADPTVGDFNNDGNLDVAWMGTGFTDGNTPVVHLATVCAGPVANTICDGASSFAIKLSSATIAPSAPSGSIVTVGGKCTQNDNNQDGSELRAPAMAVAAGQFDGTGGDELLVVPLYEDSNKDCRVVAEVYSFTQFHVATDAENNVTVTGDTLTPTFEQKLDNLGPHGHISNPSAIYAEAGRMDWSAAKDNAAIAISGGTHHTVLVIGFNADLTMLSQDDEFSTDHDKSFAGLAIGRFSSAPTADASTSCSQASDCTDTCKNSVCQISGFACTADGDCTGSCTSDGTCSYVKPNNYNLQIATFLMARSTDHSSDVYIYNPDPDSTDTAAVFPLKVLQQFNVNNFLTPAVDRGIRAGSFLRAGDLEGRSERLGTPTVLRIEGNYQPDLILEAPPAHADWLSFSSLGQDALFCGPTGECPGDFSSLNICSCDPTSNPPISDKYCADGTPLRCLVNFSVLPGTDSSPGYTSQYAFSETMTNQSSSTDTTSYSLGLSVDLKEKTKTLTPTGNQLTQEVKFASQNTYNHSVSKTNSKYKEEDFDGSARAGFYDHVWYTARDYNVYYYPVIGQTICVNTCQNGTCDISGGDCTDDSDCSNESIDPTNCDASEMQQLYVQYSGASSVSVDDYDANSMEWYQPVHEPGQILSYPWDCDELAKRYGVSICDDSADDYTLLSDTPSFLTNANQSYSMKWTVGSGESRMTIKGGQWSQSLSETVSYGTNKLESQAAGFNVSEKVSVNADESLSTAKTNTSSLGSSTGVSIATPGTFLAPTQFAYQVGGYIFGKAPAPGTVQPLTPSDDATDVLANGEIRAAFTANPLVTGAGPWWTSAMAPYKDAIDVALNRPMHLYTQSDQGHSNPSVTQCLPISQGSAVTDACAYYEHADPVPTALWTNGFYSLRGFFITPVDATSQGPQLTQANEGDLLALQVRVYNYSLKDMPQGTTIKADFYAQEWDNYCNVPAGYYDHSRMCSQTGGAQFSCAGENACGEPCCVANAPADSAFLGEAALDPLPAFNSPNQPGASNWTFARTTFDTGDPSVCGSDGCGDKYFVFWVVVWPEGTDAQGNPVLYGELPDHSLTGIPGLLKSIADICPKSNDCVDGACRATEGSCTTDADCPSAADNVCRTDGTCAISGVTCTSDSDCGACLCKVCLDEFSNNVGLYKQAFYVAPAGTEATAPQGQVALDSVTVSPTTALLGHKVIVSAALHAQGGPIDGQFVRFHAVPPESSNLSVKEVFAHLRAFDAEVLSHIRAGDVAQAQVAFHPDKLGKYEILVSTVANGTPELLGTADLNVVETPPTTPTVPANDHDGCAISDTSGHGSNGLIALLLFAAFVGLLRSRRVRQRTPDAARAGHPQGED